MTARPAPPKRSRAPRLQAGKDGPAKTERLDAEAKQREDAARTVLDHIPLGQPYLTDHHSYGADRRRRERAFDNMGRSA
jgi:hypothetical protein